MRMLAVLTLALSLGDPVISVWMQHAFYPTLFLLLVLASVGVPIPEDVPLIAAGVLLSTHPEISSWPWTLLVALVAIMSGDWLLYTLGKSWGADAVRHRSVRWLIPPQRLTRTRKQFRRYGTWMCFFGRFFMGVRAAMCLTAGVTRFPFWRFFLADLAGALLSIPFFVWLGYWFAGMVPTLRGYVTGVQWGLLGGGAAAIAGIVLYKLRKRRRRLATISQQVTSPIDAPAGSVAKSPASPAEKTAGRSAGVEIEN
jgi:membrane protein DedA with SNARE-associated domain